MRILLVGAGKMGSAMLHRWHDRKIADDILVIDTARNLKSPADLPPGYQPDVILFAVKPQILPDILPAYRRYTDGGALVISIAAGRTTAFFQQQLGDGTRIIRAMPNTPAAIGQGITGAYAAPGVDQAARTLATTLLQTVGEVIWFANENQLDAVTALSGSGPAYVFHLIECMAAAGEKLGLESDVAARLARQTVIGAAALAREEAKISPAILREAVTSPGGTTAAALSVLMQEGPGGMQDLMQKAIRAACDRAKELNA